MKNQYKNLEAMRATITKIVIEIKQPGSKDGEVAGDVVGETIGFSLASKQILVIENKVYELQKKIKFEEKNKLREEEINLRKMENTYKKKIA